MPNLKEVRNRIQSVNSTRQITSAMKMVSAAKLKRAQDAIIKLRPYSAKLTDIMNNLSGNLDEVGGAYAEKRDAKRILIVAINSNRGLCGGFNANVIKATNRLIREEFADASEVKILSIGKKAFDTFKRTDYHISEGELSGEFYSVYDDLNYENVSAISEKILKEFEKKNFDRVILVYNQFKNAATQIIQTEQLLPVEMSAEEDQSNNIDFLFEPDKAEIITALLPKALKNQIYKAVLDSNASEHGARMTAMHKATDNASDLLHQLKLSYNKARQAAITTEILEIVAGAEALDG